MEFRDGNALAGTFAESLGIDISVAVLTCAGCGRAGPVGAGRVYDRGPGAVLRCPHCEDVLMRVVRTPDDLWLDLRGARSMRIPAS